MNPISIFAGVDQEGAIRFVGDVPRGAACGCSCAACGAPLVAKRGAVNTWHFAHEASQERPECFAGAVNLLRRLAIEHLQESAPLLLPPRRVLVVTTPPLPIFQEHVEWDTGLGQVVHWYPQPVHNAPVALLISASGTKIQLFAEVATSRGMNLELVPPSEGSLLFEFPLPQESGQLKDLGSAKHYIRFSGRFLWRQFPDTHPKVAETRQRLEHQARQRQRLPAEISALQRMSGWQPPPPTQAPVRPAPPVGPISVEIDRSPWAAWRKPRNAFLFYGLKDGSAWVLFTHGDGRHVMAPWPECVDGWEETMPARLCTPDLEIGAFVLTDRMAMMVYLSDFSRTVTSASNWTQLTAIPWPPTPR